MRRRSRYIDRRYNHCSGNLSNISALFNHQGRLTDDHHSFEEELFLYSFLRNDEDRENVQEIKHILKHLPDWVEPQMVYPYRSIEANRLLGYGQYGQVHQGLFRQGNGV